MVKLELEPPGAVKLPYLVADVVTRKKRFMNAGFTLKRD